MLPVQTELISKQNAFLAPICSATRAAVAGINLSGVDVASSTAPILPTSKFFRHFFAASIAKYEVGLSGSLQWRLFMPVFASISGATLGGNWVSSEFSVPLGGTNDPVDNIKTLISLETCK